MATARESLSTDKGTRSSVQLHRSSSPHDALPVGGIVRENLGKEVHSSQLYSDHLSEKAHGDEDSKPHEDLAVGSHKPVSFRKKRKAPLESAKSYQSQMEKILQALATAPLPSPDFSWAIDIGHFNLFYRNSDTGFMITVRSDTGEYDVSISNQIGAHHLITVPTLRQAQAICHTIAWVFRESLPLLRRQRQSTEMHENPRAHFLDIPSV
jgi:hypothetical protein